MSSVSRVDLLRTPAFWVNALRARRWPGKVRGVPLVAVDLFSGCGGLSLGAYFASRALGRSFRIALAVDSWSSAVETYSENFARFASDVRCADAGTVLPCDVGPIDVLMAGPPCQGHSSLNNSSRRSDPRNSLYLIPVEFAEKHRPSLVLIENVPSVVHARERVVQLAVERLQCAGYSTFEIVVDVSSLGIPQRRKRHLLVASLRHSSQGLNDCVLGAVSSNSVPRVLDFISDLQDVVDECNPALASTRLSRTNRDRIDYLFKNDVYDLPNALRPACHREKSHSYVSMYGRIHPWLPAQTLTSGFGSMGQGRFVHPTRPRMITCREAARIQGFPDFFSFGAHLGVSELREMIANAVPPAVSAALISALFTSDVG